MKLDRYGRREGKKRGMSTGTPGTVLILVSIEDYRGDECYSVIYFHLVRMLRPGGKKKKIMYLLLVG